MDCAFYHDFRVQVVCVKCLYNIHCAWGCCNRVYYNTLFILFFKNINYFHDVHSIYTTNYNVVRAVNSVDSTDGGVQMVVILWTTFVHN